MPPPFGLTCSASSGSPSIRSTASACDANASFSSTTSTSPIASPVRSSSLRVAGAGPMPITRGGTPATAPLLIRASGASPYWATALSEATSSAAAPSFTPEALPAVTLPPGASGASLASASSEVARGCSSTATVAGSPRRCGTVTGSISRASRPSAIARAARCCERSANASWSSRETSYSSATVCAVSGIESVPSTGPSAG